MAPLIEQLKIINIMLQNICEEIKFILFSSLSIASLLSCVKYEYIILFSINIPIFFNNIKIIYNSLIKI